MFHQVAPSVCWTTYANPNTLFNVGTDVVGLLCHNILIFHDVKTKAKSYYKADNIETCGGIAVVAGNNRFPLFAIAERVLCPSIYVIKYPDMDKLIELPTTTATSYIDLHLSEYGYLVAITGSPFYTLHMWNYRTGVHYAQVNTKKCSKFCMFVTPTPEPALILYSSRYKEVSGMELCFATEKHSFHEISTIKLTSDFEKSDIFSIAFLDEAYIINDYGVVFAMSAGSFTLRSEWRTPEICTQPKAHKLFYNKNGVLVVNESSVYFIKRQNKEFLLDWKINDTGFMIYKMISDANGNIYATTDFGNLYYVDHSEETGSLRELSVTNCKVKDYCLLNGIKDEIVLLLIEDGEMRLVDIIFMNKLSSLHIDNAYCIATHNSAPFVAVGTNTGKVHFFSYEKLRAPVELSVLEIDELAIVDVELHENVALVRDKRNGIYVLNCDYKAIKFNISMSLERKSKEAWIVLRSFLLETDRAVFFVSTVKDNFNRFADHIWVLLWHNYDLFVRRRQFKLPYIYQDFTLLQPYTSHKVEFIGIRKHDFICDVLVLEENNAIYISSSIRTYHFGHINSISGSKNVITSATQGIIFHFQTHKRSKNPYCISRPLLTTYAPLLRKRMTHCFKSKFLLVLYAGGYLLVFRLPLLSDSLKENTRIEDSLEREKITKFKDTYENLRAQTIIVIPDVDQKDLEEKEKILEELSSIRKSMRELIDYDISKTGQSHGIYRKFCLNTYWLAKLTEEARIVCERERIQLLEAVKDQTRIRNWILDLIKSSNNFFGIKLHSIFSHTSMDNYGMYPIMQELLKRFDYFRFFDLDLNEDETEELPDNEKKSLNLEEEEEEEPERKLLKHFIIEKGQSVFEHVMSKDFELQDIKSVTFHQICNEDAKLQVVLIDALKQEFNKIFAMNKTFKQDTVNDILSTNAALEKIYSNMNCMLCLLKMETFKPPALSVPEWKRNENIERILTVDDSEITAINRHKKIASKSAYKSGRMLLWPVEYWVRAIMNMMDGVLEKLWEEEIKKTPSPPEFTLKKQVIEYTRDEIKTVRDYEKKLVTLEEDRHKYLRILKENEIKKLNQKKFFILKFNESIAEIAILKLKYDFAIKHEQIRLLNAKLTNFKRIVYKKRIMKDREHLDNINEYITKYSKLHDYWDRMFFDNKQKLENLTNRDKQIERQFKGQYLNSIPAHLTHELNKIYKRRPKLSAKAFNTASICSEIAERLISKKQYKFPLQQEMQEFLTFMDSLDDLQNCPNQLDHKHWENFVKIRRQKLESELRLKAVGFQLIDSQLSINFYTKELIAIKETRADLANSMSENIANYFDITQNCKLEFILTLGQVEVNILNVSNSSNSFMVMHVDDINEVNDLIRKAGRKKINAMQRVAFFRRQVIYKEWEHKVVKANIEYLQYVLKLIQNCKINHEFLEILRNWKRLEEFDASSVVGSIELKINQRIDAANKNLKYVQDKINIVRHDIRNIRYSNNAINKQIEDLKTDVTMLNACRDLLSEEKLVRERNERLTKLKNHRTLYETVRRDYVQIMELSTILELQRLRTYPTLGPAPQCAYID